MSVSKRYKAIPIIFLIFGAVLITLISGYSIRKHIKTMSNSNQQSGKASVEASKEDSKIFFNKPQVMPAQALIKVYKEKRILELYGDEKLLGRFQITLGRDPGAAKEKEGDARTPEGTYYICSKTSETKYTYFMGLSYPNIEDAQKGLEKGIINQNTYNRIKKAIDSKQQPPWNTMLGGAIGIHGGGNKDNWTYGCIAMSNEDINILKVYTPFKTTVEIYK